MAIRIVITGGTFDKHYDELRGQLTFKDSHLPGILEQCRLTVPVELEINQLTDSLDMRMSNRLSILESCRRAPEEQIVVIHGTDTMTETARVLGEADLSKAIVLTGAMVPYAVTNSDAVFNLGCAITAVQLVRPGVYVVMNGTVFPWDNVRKNPERGVFEPVSGNLGPTRQLPAVLGRSAHDLGILGVHWEVCGSRFIPVTYRRAGYFTSPIGNLEWWWALAGAASAS